MRYEDRYFHTRTVAGEPCPLSAKGYANQVYDTICKKLAEQPDFRSPRDICDEVYLAINTAYVIQTPVKISLQGYEKYIHAEYRPSTDDPVLITVFPIGFGLQMYKRRTLHPIIERYQKAKEEMFKAVQDTLNKYGKAQKREPHHPPEHYAPLGIEFETREDQVPGLEGEPRFSIRLNAWWRNPKPEDQHDEFHREIIDAESLFQSEELLCDYLNEVESNRQKRKKEEEAELAKWNLEREHKDLIRLALKYPELAKETANGRTSTP